MLGDVDQIGEGLLRVMFLLRCIRLVAFQVEAQGGTFGPGAGEPVAAEARALQKADCLI